MTEELFREDAFARQCEASVVGLGPDGVRLDRTVFYCTGGGTPRITTLWLRVPAAI